MTERYGESVQTGADRKVSKGGPENDFSVCTTWCVTREKQWYLLDVWRKRVDYPELKAAVETLAVTFRAQRVLVEDAGAGISLVQELRSRVSGIIAVRPERDKVSRMAVVSAKFEAGEVFLPERAPWLGDFEVRVVRLSRQPSRRPMRFRQPGAVRDSGTVSDAHLARSRHPHVAACARSPT